MSLQIQVLKKLINDGNLPAEEHLAIDDLLDQLTVSKNGLISKRSFANEHDISLKMLNSRIRSTENLYFELNQKFGYTKYRKYLSPGEVRIIQRGLFGNDVEIN